MAFPSIGGVCPLQTLRFEDCCVFSAGFRVFESAAALILPGKVCLKRSECKHRCDTKVIARIYRSRIK